MPPNPQNLTAYCGLYCPKCYKMVISEAASTLKNALKSTHICGKKNLTSAPFKQTLNDLITLHCPKICKDGGGNPDCKIRKCCVVKNIIGCWECNDYETCENLTEQFVGCIKKIKKQGLDGYIKERIKK